VLSNDEILKRFTRDVGHFFNDTDEWRAESANNYRIYDSHETDKESRNDFVYERLNSYSNRGYGKDTLNGKLVAVANLSAPYLRAVHGMIMMELKRITAQSMDEEFDAEIDVMSDGIEWAQETSGWKPAMGRALLDNFVTGIGGTVTYLDFSYMEHPFGVPVVEDKQFIYYDRSQMGGNINRNASFVGYAEPMYHTLLDDYIDEMGGFEESDYTAGNYRERILENVHSENEDRIDFLYNYFWYERETIYDVENIFYTYPEILAGLAESQFLGYDVLGQMSDELQLDMQSPYWSLDKKSYRKLKDYISDFEFITGGELEPPKKRKRSGKVYYRAQIARGKLLMAGRSYTQQCHAFNPIVGFYDRWDGFHYGLMRPLSQLQRLLNGALSDFGTYAHRSATGGTVGVTGMSAELANTARSIIDKNQVIPLPKDSTINNLGTSDATSAMSEMIEKVIRMIPLSLGVPPEILGVLSTKDHGSALFSQIRQQIYISLSSLLDNVNNYLMNQGYIFRDLIIEMTETRDRIMLPRMTFGSDQQQTFELSKQNIARNYAIKLVQREATDDEMQEQFRMLVEFAQLLPETERISVLPEIMRMSRIDYDNKKRIMEALQPKQPDPMQQQMQMAQFESQIRLTNAQAAQLESTAMREQAGAQEDMAQAEVDRRKAFVEIDKANADIELKDAQADKTQAETADIINDIGMKTVEQFTNQLGI
jgi:hypothetical protein